MSLSGTYTGRDVASGEGIRIRVAEGAIVAREPCGDDGLPWISPGLVDLQVNGYAGYDLNGGDLDPETVEALSESLLATGVTAYLPTLITASRRDLCQRLAAIAEASETFPLSRRMIAGIHIEGPAISKEDGPRGAHPLDHVRPATAEELADWQAHAGGRLRIVTLAPETPGAMAFIRHASAQGLLLSIGHTAADPECIHSAAAAGATLSTHLGNGIAPMLPRHPNAIWAQLANDALTPSFIADGHHLPRDALRAMIRAKGVSRSILVSDSVALAGMPAGRYRTPIGGDVDMSADGRVSVAGTPFLAGSGRCLAEMVGRLPGMTGLGLADAVAMSTVQPARIIDHPCGLGIGDRAAFILFDWSEAEEDLVICEAVLDFGA